MRSMRQHMRRQLQHLLQPPWSCRSIRLKPSLRSRFGGRNPARARARMLHARRAERLIMVCAGRRRTGCLQGGRSTLIPQRRSCTTTTNPRARPPGTGMASASAKPDTHKSTRATLPPRFPTYTRLITCPDTIRRERPQTNPIARRRDLVDVLVQAWRWRSGTGTTGGTCGTSGTGIHQSLRTTRDAATDVAAATHVGHGNWGHGESGHEPGDTGHESDATTPDRLPRARHDGSRYDGGRLHADDARTDATTPARLAPCCGRDDGGRHDGCGAHARIGAGDGSSAHAYGLYRRYATSAPFWHLLRRR